MKDAYLYRAKINSAFSMSLVHHSTCVQRWYILIFGIKCLRSADTSEKQSLYLAPTFQSFFIASPPQKHSEHLFVKFHLCESHHLTFASFISWSEKPKSACVVSESNTEAKSQLSSITSLYAVTIANAGWKLLGLMC